MRIFQGTQQLPVFRNTVLTIGTFDGVHLGHRKLIDEVISKAAEFDGESLLITFHPHPRSVLKPADNRLRLLHTLAEKTAKLAESGLQNLVVVPFTQEFSSQTAEEYVKNFLLACFRPRLLVIGYDHRFGRNREGDITLLQQLAPEFGFGLEEIPRETIDEIGISSTKIRNALQERNIALANELLGYPYSVSGKVVKGFQRGREMGYPTANIVPSDPCKLIPGTGIYAVEVEWQGRSLKGMLSVGYNPTFGESEMTIEVNILDFNEDIYGHHLHIRFLHFVRAEQKFSGMEELKEAIAEDETNIRKWFNENI